MEQKYRDAIRVNKSSGPRTYDERVLREKAAKAVVKVLSTSATKLINYGVPEEQAYHMMFSPVADAVLLRMVQALSHALRKSIKPSGY